MGRKNKNARQIPRGKKFHADKYVKNKYINSKYINDKYMQRKAADKSRTLDMKKAMEERRELSHLGMTYGTEDTYAAGYRIAEAEKHPHAFEIWFAYLGNHYGTSVQSGCRPVLIVSNDKANRVSHTVTVLPLTSKLKKLDLPTHVRISSAYCDIGGTDSDNGSEQIMDSVILAEQIVTVDKSMLNSRMCRLDSEEKRSEVVKAIAVQLGMTAEEDTADKGLRVDNEFTTDNESTTDSNFTETEVKHNGG